eukprot:CAMPEP_0178673030 /NCGR_PEP_ID=MMETSP0698-20121128/34083_1 /TAXON_ID=265572 /ORGANISM="Extubocellulus spinifer, Strain CCMP396" /LENGTH=310 /DNA_ID=CAMNT_0020317011 /DNA_START=73 /DNA_END=1001 /DNA_ORIENTATION=+
MEDLNRIYLSHSTSIIKCTPQPTPYHLDGHARFSVKEVLALFLAKGIPADFIMLGGIGSEEYENSFSISDGLAPSLYSETKDCTELVLKLQQELHDSGEDLLQDLHMAVSLTPWSDDFVVTEDDQSVWALTLTITPPKGVSSANKLYTYPISLGSKDADHSSVLDIFFQELEEMKRPQRMFSLAHRGFVKVWFHSPMYLGDRPERAKVTSTLSYASPLSRQSMNSMQPNLNDLCSCDVCMHQRLTKLSGRSPLNCSPPCNANDYCNNCTDWNPLKGVAGSISSKIYPETCLQGSPPLCGDRLPRQKNSDG